MPQSALSSELSLIIVELAADWPSPTPRRGALCRVLAQRDGELPGDFAQRVQVGLDEAAAGALILRTVVLALNERLDPCAQAARHAIAEGAARTVSAAAGGGGILVTACDRNGGRSRQPLSSWTSALSKAWRPRRVECKLRWSSTAPAVRPARAGARREPVARPVSESVRHVA